MGGLDSLKELFLYHSWRIEDLLPRLSAQL